MAQISVQRRRFKFIGCEIIYREACLLAARSRHHVDVEFLRKGLHDLKTPDMIAKIQATIDAVDTERRYEAILLGYARCNNGLVGIVARDIPLVILRAHDCITFFFGGRDRYQAYFDQHPGTYYMSTGWAERNDAGDGEYAKPAYGQTGVMGELGLTDTYEQLVEKYGKDNADFIVAATGNWKDNYKRFLYLQMGVCDEADLIEETRLEAAKQNWEFDLRQGDMGLLTRLFEGDWNDDFVIVQPGQKIVARNDASVLGAE